MKSKPWPFKLAISSFSLLVFTLTINYFRQPLLGVVEGYAPHNFAFNFAFFLPAMLLSFILGLIAILLTIIQWKKWNHLNQKLAWILLSCPVILLVAFVIIKILIIS